MLITGREDIVWSFFGQIRLSSCAPDLILRWLRWADTKVERVEAHQARLRATWAGDMPLRLCAAKGRILLCVLYL